MAGAVGGAAGRAEGVQVRLELREFRPELVGHGRHSAGAACLRP